MSSNSDAEEDVINKCKWEKYSSGFASKMFEKMGYKGGGLGKLENGIRQPIEIEKKHIFSEQLKQEIHTCNDNSRIKKDIICVMSDSMLNQLNQTRLSKRYDVRVMCHGGCTIRCMYTHLPKMFPLNPKYVILHIGTNDGVRKTSDEILKELVNLENYVQTVLPHCKVIVSQPAIRADNRKANQILQNLNVKLKCSHFVLLDNSNIKRSHLGNLGLHFNERGTRKIASNIISLIKRL